jgi:hypothetical protein
MHSLIFDMNWCTHFADNFNNDEEWLGVFFNEKHVSPKNGLTTPKVWQGGRCDQLAMEGVCDGGDGIDTQREMHLWVVQE